jgi:hypothetical protein
MWGALSDERTGLSFTLAAGPSHRSHSRVRAPWDSRPYFTVSDLRLPISPPPTTRRVSRWRYSTPPPRGYHSYSQSRIKYVFPFYNSGRTEQRTLPITVRLLLQAYFLLRICVLANRFLAMDYIESICCSGNLC